jgi:hypothetical protein
MRHEAKDAMDRTSEAMNRAGEQVSQMAQDNNYVQETQH